ncbi:MAG: hypothetical protein HRT57_07935 [Crocinitomicaceae bacterium]|nr:hypothetical protein [Crocinitomicaceae bacterium]
MNGWQPAIHNGKKVSVEVDLMYSFETLEIQLIYRPQNSRVISSKGHKKRPAVKITMITLALGIPIIAIIMSYNWLNCSSSSKAS